MKAIMLPNNEDQSFTFFLKKNICNRLGIPHATIRDNRSHFCNCIFKAMLKINDVKNKVAKPYHHQMSG